jgi:uncharacterized protein DUF4349/putative zinc finger protein
MKISEHWLSDEELMAHLDGEVDAARAAAVRAHLEGCDRCQHLVRELEGLSNRLAEWQVGEPPATLQAPQTFRPGSRWSEVHHWLGGSRFAAAAAVGFLIVAGAVWRIVAPITPPPTPATAVANRSVANAPAAGRITEGDKVSGLGYVAGTRQPAPAPARPQGQSPGGGGGGGISRQPDANGPLIALTATLALVAKDFDAVRPAIDRILREAGGFIGRIDVSGSRGTPRTLSASLRIPSARLQAALAGLKTIGTVTRELESGDDVTEPVRDLDVRLANAKATEARLLDVLAHRTGKVADVLEAEREIARVRGEIEQMDAERTSFDRRVSYATVSLTVDEERKADLDLGPLPPSARLRNALVDGWRAAAAQAFDLVVALLTAGPTVLLWAIGLAWPAWLVRRRRQRGGAASLR